MLYMLLNSQDFCERDGEHLFIADLFWHTLLKLENQSINIKLSAVDLSVAIFTTCLSIAESCIPITYRVSKSTDLPFKRREDLIPT